MLNDIDLKFIQENNGKSVSELMLKYHSKDDLDYKFLIQQISAREKVKKRIPTLCENSRVVFPPSLNLEQCSSEITAKYKRDFIKTVISDNALAVDLTSGLGIDAIFMSENFKEYHHVEPNRNLLNISENNYRVLGLDNVATYNSTAEEYIASHKDDTYDFIYLDPSRRDDTSGEKVVLIDAYSPNLIELEDDLLKMSKNILVKTSPILDYNDTIYKIESVKEIHIVSIKNEVKEVLYLLERDFRGEVMLKTINFISDTKFDELSMSKTELKESEATFSDPLTYLYEPNSSIMKSLAFNYISQYFAIGKLHSNSHLYTSNAIIENFPGRIFTIEQIKSAKKKDLKSIKKAHISCRNFPMSVVELRKKFGIKEGGDTYIFATTIENGDTTILICKK